MLQFYIILQNIFLLPLLQICAHAFIYFSMHPRSKIMNKPLYIGCVQLALLSESDPRLAMLIK